MERYIAVDSGKFATKVAVYDEVEKKIIKYKFRTKISEGTMDDDEIEAYSCVVEIDGKCYKVGSGAIEEAELETTKATEIHRICTLTAIGKFVSEKEEDLVHVAFGLPITEYEDKKKKLAYKDFILPPMSKDEDACARTGKILYLPSKPITVIYKETGDSLPVSKTFRIASKVVYAESSGALYLDATRFSTGTTAVIDKEVAHTRDFSRELAALC